MGVLFEKSSHKDHKVTKNTKMGNREVYKQEFLCILINRGIVVG
jgi:hypothetical protein